MPERFHGVQFTDPARAKLNLARMEQRLPTRLGQTLPTLLAQVPDPDGALNYLERYLRDDGREALDHTLRYIERNPAALHYLLLVFSYSRFLSETLVQQPELAEWLHRPSRTRQFRGGIERVKPDEDLEEEFARFETTILDLEPARILARFKRREYLRIMLRDVLGLATLADTTLEISQLADLLLRRALRMAEQTLQASYGAPQHADANGRVLPAALIVLALGKLGAQELNYASDIDLMFLYDRDGQTAGGSLGSITNGEYFVRLSHALLKLITTPTPEGAVFRVDVRLRPQGTEGFIALSVPGALDYYRTRAREWELQMLIKARPAAGNFEAGRRLLHALHPLIFRPEFNLAAVEAVLNAREEMTRSLTLRATPLTQDSDHEARWNVKLSPGGIRDIEFLAQCLQRLHGGADSWLSSSASAPTLVALQRLHDKGHLSGHDFFRLSSAYQFLRKVEHRLQLRDGLQRHTLPSRDALPPGALDRLARRCGIEAPPAQAAEQLLARVRQCFSQVQEIYDRLIRPRGEAMVANESAQEPAVPLASSPALLQRIGREFPASSRAAQQAAATGGPYARRGLDRYLSAVVLEPEVMRQLEQHPGWLDLSAQIFARSDLAVDMLSRHVADIHYLADSDAEVSPLGSQRALFSSHALGAARTAARRRVLRLLADAALGRRKPFETFACLSQLADEALCVALPQARPESVAEFDPPQAPFAVLGLGRLATREMDFGSDADLVFVTADTLGPEQREPWRRLAEQFIHVVSSQTREGSFFPVDTRLRPQGAAGDIVISAASLCDYLRNTAQAWEALTYCKIRPVAGNLALGWQVVDQLRKAFAARWSGKAALGEMAAQLAALRARMESEGTGIHARGEFKHLPGGFYDLEYIVGMLVFRHGLLANAPTQSRGPGNILEQIAALETADALSPEETKTLQHAAALFRATDHAHRVVTGRAANRPPEPALAERLTILLRTWDVLPADSAPLHDLLSQARTGVRSLYQRVFATAGGS